MWVFKVLFGYDRTPNKSVEPHFGSTNTDCTGQTDRRFLREKPMFLSAKGTTKKADAFDFFVYPNLFWAQAVLRLAGSQPQNSKER